MKILKLNINPTIIDNPQKSTEELMFALKYTYKKDISSKISNNSDDIVCGFGVINFLFDDIKVCKTDSYQPPKFAFRYLFNNFYCDEILEEEEVIIGTNSEICVYLTKRRRKKKLNKIFS